MLTIRTALEPLAAASGKPLKVANFQLSMPHVEGCTRKGMPLQTAAVQLPKSELKFVVERITRCPLAPTLTEGPQYRPRKVELITQQNHLHHIGIRVLAAVIGAFNTESPNAIAPLRKISTMLGKMEPLALFLEWSPPRQLSEAKLLPKEVTTSSVFDEEHSSIKALDNESGYWRSAKATGENLQCPEEWLVCQFNAAVTLSSIELKWRANFVPEQVCISISRDGMSYEPVAVVVEQGTEMRVLVPKGASVTSIKITMFGKTDATFALESISCKEAAFSSVHTPTGVVLRDIQQWLFGAAVSSIPEVRDLALEALQKLMIASGSLCGLLELATCLVLNTRPVSASVSANIDSQTWNHLDLLTENAKASAKTFLKELAISIQQVVVGYHPQPGQKPLLDKRLIQQMMLLQEEGPNYNANFTAGSNPFNMDHSDQFIRLVTLMVGHEAFLNSITRRSQLGMIILHMLSELSAWHMKRMQKAEAFTGKRELELMQLEEPFSMEICPDFFAISHRLLTSVLARWLPGGQTTGKGNIHTEMEEKESREGPSNRIRNYEGNDLYQNLSSSFGCFRAATEKQQKENDGNCGGCSKFSADGICVAVLQIITSNLRRLVLSRINPADIGITPAAGVNDDDLLSAPPALNPTVSALEQLISLGTKRNDMFFPVSLKAAAAMEVGTEVFYPSAHQRTKVLASRMGKGATLEVQVRWPVQEQDQEDPRYERLILMLQFECIKLGIRHAIRGSWFFFMHLIVEVPQERDTEEVLTQQFAPCIQRAGFSSWQVAAGAQELSINLQRHLHWNRIEKMSQDSGAGWIRVYPADVAAFNEVLSDVEGFLEGHNDFKSKEPRP